LSHSLSGLLHQNPFMYRAYSKSRGYAGDAVTMHYIYGLGKAPMAAREATPLGRAILHYMDTRPTARGVRRRRRLIAELIDLAAARGVRSVLAIAVGHLREVELSAAAQTGKLEEFVAFDQDAASPAR
jgi:extracellular factor (EF) 3-hydroxypalmitic acid methyl ester biosynthesis protein